MQVVRTLNWSHWMLILLLGLMTVLRFISPFEDVQRVSRVNTHGFPA